MLKFDPSVIQIEKVLEGDFFSGGGQPIAFVQLIDMRKGEMNDFSDPTAACHRCQRQRDGLWTPSARASLRHVEN